MYIEPRILESLDNSLTFLIEQICKEWNNKVINSSVMHKIMYDNGRYIYCYLERDNDKLLEISYE